MYSFRSFLFSIKTLEPFLYHKIDACELGFFKLVDALQSYNQSRQQMLFKNRELKQ